MNTSTKITFLAAAGLAASSAFANSVALTDFSFSLFNGDVQVADATLDVRWGTYSGGVFTPFLSAAYNDNNTGYADLSSPELSVSLTQGDNVAVPAGTVLALAITNFDFGTTYTPSEFEVILTDPTWVAPTFALVGLPDLDLTLTSNTTALKGQYSFNGGNEILNLQAIPEPSAFAALAGLAVLGGVATRRRRSA